MQKPIELKYKLDKVVSVGIPSHAQQKFMQFRRFSLADYALMTNEQRIVSLLIILFVEANEMSAFSLDKQSSSGLQERRDLINRINAWLMSTIADAIQNDGMHVFNGISAHEYDYSSGVRKIKPDSKRKMSEGRGTSRAKSGELRNRPQWIAEKSFRPGLWLAQRAAYSAVIGTLRRSKIGLNDAMIVSFEGSCKNFMADPSRRLDYRLGFKSYARCV